MGNRFSRRRDTPPNKSETAEAEQTAAEEPASNQPAEDSDVTQTQEAVSAPESGEEKSEVTESATLQASLPAEESKEVEVPAAPAPEKDAEPEPVTNDTVASVQPEPLVSLSESSAPESVEEPKPVAPVEPEPLVSVSEPSPPEFVEEPQPIGEVTEAAPAEPEPASEPEVSAVPELLSEPVPAPVEVLEQEIDLLSQETVPEPQLSVAPLVDLNIPEPTPLSTISPPSPPPSPIPVNADEPPEVKESQDSSDVAIVPEEETSLESPKEAMENLEQLVNDVSEENVSGLLKKLDLTGDDPVADLIDGEVKIPDESPLVDINTEMM